MQPLRRKSVLDHTAIAELYEHYWLTILLFIRQHIPVREDAEDVLLEVFLAALEDETLVTLAEKQQLVWLRHVAYNKCVDYHRRATRRPAVPLDEAAEVLFDDETSTPEQTALLHEEHAILRTHIASLPELQQEILRLRFANGLRCAEIGRLVNKSEGAVRTHLSRSLNLLRGIYDRK
jgi:RNA polymerase sigma factor (sigma-70 family)